MPYGKRQKRNFQKTDIVSSEPISFEQAKKWEIQEVKNLTLVAFCVIQKMRYVRGNAPIEHPLSGLFYEG